LRRKLTGHKFRLIDSQNDRIIQRRQRDSSQKVGWLFDRDEPAAGIVLDQLAVD
jgi:hypothetical protein